MKTLGDACPINISCSDIQSSSLLYFTSDLQAQVYDNSCNFDTSKPIIILVHGYDSTPYTYNFTNLTEKLIQKGNTVFSLDWSEAACYDISDEVQRVLCYCCAANNTREVGNLLASMVKPLIDKCGISLSQITFMGHSLGAHVAGFACKNLQKSGYGKPSLLIGMDPAAPLFTDKGCSDKICYTDATHVRILHTSLFGLQCTLGDSDYWFNNGPGQPACGATNNTIIDNSMLASILNDASVKCSHIQSIIYLILTLDHTFVGVPILPLLLPYSCETSKCIAVDEKIFDSNYNATGNTYVCVNSVYPYTTTTKYKCQ